MIRCKVTPRFTDEGVHVLLEWVEIGADEIILSVFATEEFAISRERIGSAYISRAAFAQGEVRPGTFWVDTNGNRHFVMMAEPGHIGTIGLPTSFGTT